MKIKVKKLDPEAKLPSYAHPGDAGMDWFALEDTLVKAGEMMKIRTGVSIEIPDGFVGLVWDKSSISMNFGLKTMGGVVDAGYRGEVMIGMINLSKQDYKFEKHHKVAQMLIQPVGYPELEESEELSSTSRGAGGFGSTGK